MEKKQTTTISIPSILPAVIVTLVAGLLVGYLVGSALTTKTVSPIIANNTGFAALPSSDIGAKTIKYLNDNFLTSQGLTAKLTGVTDYGQALYSVSLAINDTNNKSSPLDVFVTKDGNLLLVLAQSPINLNEKITPPAQPPQAETKKLPCSDIKKQDTAQLEAFVVSYCPYGLQAQRILAPIAKAGLAGNIKVRYLGWISDGKLVSMHDNTTKNDYHESQENMRQICIREEQSGKYWDYISEFIKKGDSSTALTTAKVDVAKVNACMADSARGLKFAQEDIDRADSLKQKLGTEQNVPAAKVSFSSPSFVINGQAPLQYDSYYDIYGASTEFAYQLAEDVNASARSAENVKQLICCASNSQTAACATALSGDQAAIAFSEKYSGTSSTGAAKCG